MEINNIVDKLKVLCFVGEKSDRAIDRQQK